MGELTVRLTDMANQVLTDFVVTQEEAGSGHWVVDSSNSYVYGFKVDGVVMVVLYLRHGSTPLDDFEVSEACEELLSRN